MRTPLLLALLALSAIVAPTLLDVPTAHACQPRTYWCPLNGDWYYTCHPAPIVQCAQDAAKDMLRP